MLYHRIERKSREDSKTRTLSVTLHRPQDLLGELTVQPAMKDRKEESKALPTDTNCSLFTTSLR